MSFYAEEMSKARALVNECLEKVGRPDVTITLEWNGRFTSRMGDARPTGLASGRVRLSRPLWPHATEAERRHTVIHEAAHVLAVVIHGPAGRGHGSYWKRTMVLLGETPKRCHNVDRPDYLKRKRKPRRVHTCPCGQTLRIGPTQYKRLQRGTHVYQCRRCKRPIKVPRGD